MMPMTNPEFAKYTSELNAAAKEASSRLRMRHLLEWEDLMTQEMSLRGYIPNPMASDPGQKRWIRKEY